jgi:hypothetical protein
MSPDKQEKNKGIGIREDVKWKKGQKPRAHKATRPFERENMRRERKRKEGRDI